MMPTHDYSRLMKKPTRVWQSKGSAKLHLAFVALTLSLLGGCHTTVLLPSTLKKSDPVTADADSGMKYYKKYETLRVPMVRVQQNLTALVEQCSSRIETPSDLTRERLSFKLVNVAPGRLTLTATSELAKREQPRLLLLKIELKQAGPNYTEVFSHYHVADTDSKGWRLRELALNWAAGDVKRCSY